MQKPVESTFSSHAAIIVPTDKPVPKYQYRMFDSNFDVPVTKICLFLKVIQAALEYTKKPINLHTSRKLIRTQTKIFFAFSSFGNLYT